MNSFVRKNAKVDKKLFATVFFEDFFVEKCFGKALFMNYSVCKVYLRGIEVDSCSEKSF
jgi:hypothetical protein